MTGNVKRFFPTALILSWILVTSSPATAAASYYFSNFVPNVPSATYDWTSNQQIISVMGYANGTGYTGSKFLFWDWKPAVGARFFSDGTNTIPYSIYKYISNSVSNELYTYSSGVTKNNVFSNTIAAPFYNSPLPFAIIPTAGLLRPAGVYTTSITVGYYTGTLSGSNISNAKNTGATYSQQINLTVPVIYDLSIMPSGDTTFNAGITSQTLNFGDMVDGESMSANAIIRTNSNSWSLAVASTNAGNMKNNSTSTTVPYTFTYDGTIKPLSTSSTEIESGGWADTQSGYATRILTFTLGDTFNTPGTYNDNLTFTLTAN